MFWRRPNTEYSPLSYFSGARASSKSGEGGSSTLMLGSSSCFGLFEVSSFSVQLVLTNKSEAPRAIEARGASLLRSVIEVLPP